MDFEAGYDAADKAIDINPNYALAHLWKGRGLASDGRAEEALTEFDLMERLSPRDPLLWLADIGRATACLTLGDNDRALSWTRKAIQHPNTSFISYMLHAITLIKFGRTDEAREAVAETMRLRPDFSLKVARALPASEHLTEMYIDSLRAAGVPE